MENLVGFLRAHEGKSAKDLSTDVAWYFVLLNDVPEPMPGLGPEDVATQFMPGEPTDSQGFAETIVYPLVALGGPGAMGEVRVGRGPGNDITLNHTCMSGMHAVFQLGAGAAGVRLMDVGSLNGTTVDGQRLVPRIPAELAAGQKVSFGQGYSGTFHTAASLSDFLQFLKSSMGF